LHRLVNFLALAAIYCTAQFFAGLALFKAVAEFRSADRVSAGRLQATGIPSFFRKDALGIKLELRDASITAALRAPKRKAENDR
jgi:hypothetical protein